MTDTNIEIEVACSNLWNFKAMSMSKDFNEINIDKLRGYFVDKRIMMSRINFEETCLLLFYYLTLFDFQTHLILWIPRLWSSALCPWCFIQSCLSAFRPQWKRIYHWRSILDNRFIVWFFSSFFLHSWGLNQYFLQKSKSISPVA